MMFGAKLKTWMETHIGRPKKKSSARDRGKDNKNDKVFLESSESLAQSDTGISSTSLQVSEPIFISLKWFLSGLTFLVWVRTRTLEEIISAYNYVFFVILW